ncbi:M48 family metalloprotease [Alcaligenaceae bacterium CGII-47]|nr:M48 family metalloprotease [Alcaligenaceae bacterium CGII-47]
MSLIVLSATLLSACQNLPTLPFVPDSAADARELTDALPAPEARQWPHAGDDVLNQRARAYGLVRMPEMQAYLDGLLARIKRQAGVPEWPGSVYILASSTLDAYTTAAGNIYISQSWLSSATSEDEIVGVLSHEFAHVYLHYHKLDEVVPATDKAAQLASAGATLVMQMTGTGAQGWTDVDSLVAGYTVGRDLLSTAWGRSQESSADLLGLNISLQLGYSYDAGYKAFLERLASWQEDHAAHQAQLEKEMLDQVMQRASAAVEAGNDTPNSEVSKAMFKPLSALAGGIAGLMHLGQTGVEKLWSASTSRHPDTIARLDRLTMAIDELPLEDLQFDATTKPWRQARAQRRTAATLRNYQMAVQAVTQLDHPKAYTWARQSAAGVTATHAFPLDVLVKAQMARGAAQSRAMNPATASAVLDRNIAAPSDRAWISYATRSQALLRAGQTARAQAIINQGFNYFNDAPEVWPATIAMMAATQGVDEAKRLAQTCAQRFPNIGGACQMAARSPAEKAAADRQAEQKAEALLNRIMNK